jgi:hypothetical protein
LPVAFKPFARWKAITALAVPDPKMPSAPPRTVMPALINACCKATTRGPRSG